MIYTLTRDDMPSLSAWIKKSKSFLGLGFFVSPVRKRTGEKPLILLGFAQFFFTN